ncbi:hypothetical protein HPB50_026298 [Hyalomma asiaticum]|uniref:Uncharacterized protein n=1 Tax=Hyalomma asiaticum TaxID=266040 RepID=A0ACB7TRH5_HYAAI|nr:hypothetical protein HPB50_026298 [Hyalomma asiaticum]
MAGRRPPAVAAGAPALADVGTRVSDMVPRRERERERAAGEACEGDSEGTGGGRVLSPGSPLGRALTRSTLMAQEEHAVHTGRPRVRVPVGAASGPCASNPSSDAAAAATDRGGRHTSAEPTTSVVRHDRARTPPFTTAQLEKVRPPEALEEERRPLAKRRRTSSGPVVCVCVSRGPRGGSSSLPVEENLLGGLPPRRLFRNAYSGMHAMGKKERRTTDAATPLSLHIPEPRAGHQSCPACAQVPAEVAALAGMQTKYVTVADVKTSGAGIALDVG